jgi:hypothetical protein
MEKKENLPTWTQMCMVQDHPPSPNDSLLLPPLDSLHKAHVRNQDLPQPGDSRPVKPPCQRAISNQMMKKWEPWDTNTRKSNNSRMFQQLSFHTQQITKATSTQDLDPRPLANNEHPSVLLTYLLKCTSLNQVNHRHGPYVGNLWDFSAML